MVTTHLLEDLATKYHTQVFVGHVLRYTPFYHKIKEIILNGEIGEICSMELAEHVGGAHYAGSFIRGRWKSEKECGSTMLLAKSCHDTDIMCWLNNSTEPVSVSSYGGRFHFVSKNAPKGATEFCYQCPHEKECYYSAIKLYYECNCSSELTYVKLNKDVITNEDKMNFLKTDDFGRCIYTMPDADMIDRQVMITEFANGSVATFSLIGGAPEANRTVSIIGTEGEIEGKFEDGIIKLKKFKFNSIAPEVITIDVSKEASRFPSVGGHNGGDYYIMDSITDYLNGDRSIVTITKLSDSINGHLCVFAADESRLTKQKIAIKR